MRTFAHLVVVCGFVSGAAAVSAQQPVTLTSTTDFQRGNNEGLISTAQDRVTRGLITAGTMGAWSSSTGLPSQSDSHTSTTYNGFVYVIGGRDLSTGAYLDGVRVAPINANGSIGAWSTTTALPSARGWLSSVAYNGFLYVSGGQGAASFDDVSSVVPFA